MRCNTLKKEYIGDRESFFKKITQVLGVVNELPSIDNLAEQYQQTANAVLSRKFQILGAETTICKGVWNCDVNNGYYWSEKKWHLKYKIGAKGINADVKFPWELSRCHHLLWLGGAYRITKEEKYARDIIGEIDNWIDSNLYLRE